MTKESGGRTAAGYIGIMPGHMNIGYGVTAGHATGEGDAGGEVMEVSGAICAEPSAFMVIGEGHREGINGDVSVESLDGLSE